MKKIDLDNERILALKNINSETIVKGKRTLVLCRYKSYDEDGNFVKGRQIYVTPIELKKQNRKGIFIEDENNLSYRMDDGKPLGVDPNDLYNFPDQF
jgi:hypothetical protein